MERVKKLGGYVSKDTNGKPEFATERFPRVTALIALERKL